MKPRFVMACVLGTVAFPAMASDLCDELWLTRNLIIDRAGYCFDTRLGQAIFDNADCATSVPELEAADAILVARVRGIEDEFDCRVDTSRRTLNIPGLALRLGLDTLPVADGLESACLGWRLAPAGLRNGAGDTFPVIGRVNPGDDLLYSHENEGAYSFVTVRRNGALVSQGWGVLPFSEDACAQVAG